MISSSTKLQDKLSSTSCSIATFCQRKRAFHREKPLERRRFKRSNRLFKHRLRTVHEITRLLRREGERITLEIRVCLSDLYVDSSRAIFILDFQLQLDSKRLQSTGDYHHSIKCEKNNYRDQHLFNLMGFWGFGVLGFWGWWWWYWWLDLVGGLVCLGGVLR